jgi:hypothetical protein
MRLLLSNPNLGHRLEANHIGSKMPSDSIESKEWQKPHWQEDSNESKKLHQLQANHNGSKMPSDSIESKERQKPRWLEDSNESKELHQLLLKREPRDSREPEPQEPEPEYFEPEPPEPELEPPGTELIIQEQVGSNDFALERCRIKLQRTLKMLLSQAPASIKNTVGSNSGRMPKSKMVPNLLAPPTHAHCRVYNGRAKSNYSKEYEEELIWGENIEAIMNYGYLINKARSSLVSRITIPIQVCEGDFRSRPLIQIKCSNPRSLSNDPSKVESSSVKMMFPVYCCIAIDPSLSTPENNINKQSISSSLHRGASPYCPSSASWLPRDTPSISISVIAIHFQHQGLSILSAAKTAATAITKVQPQVYCCVAMSNNSLPSSCEGDSHKPPTLLELVPSYLGSIVASSNYCKVVSSNQTMHHPPLDCEGDCSHSHRLIIDWASAPATPAASRQVKEKGLVHSAAISIGTIHTISSLPQLSNPSSSVCKGEKSRPEAQPENFGLKAKQDQRINDARGVKMMQSKFSHSNYTRRSCLISPLVYKGAAIICDDHTTIPASPWLPRETQSANVIVIPQSRRRGRSIPSATFFEGEYQSSSSSTLSLTPASSSHRHCIVGSNPSSRLLLC